MSAALAGRRIVMTLWAGSLWSAGFIVAPMLFATLEDRQLAGMLAGELFTAVAWLGMACLLLLLGFEGILHGRAVLRRWTTLLLGLALVITLAGEAGVRPLMAAARGGDGFVMLHTISSLLHLAVSAIALALVAWREPAPPGLPAQARPG